MSTSTQLPKHCGYFTQVETVLLGVESYNETSVIDLQPPNYLLRVLIALALCFPLGLPALITSLSVTKHMHSAWTTPLCGYRYTCAAYIIIILLVEDWR